MSHKFAKCFFALLAAIGLAFTVNYATAQSNVSGSISGTVTDATGAVISGASVTITNTDRGEDIRVTQDQRVRILHGRSAAAGQLQNNHCGFSLQDGGHRRGCAACG